MYCYWSRLVEQVIDLHWMNMVKSAGNEDTGIYSSHQIPLELVRVFVKGAKQTSNVGKDLEDNIVDANRQENSIRRRTCFHPKYLI